MAKKKKAQGAGHAPRAKGSQVNEAQGNGGNGQAQGLTARRLALLANAYLPIPAQGKAVRLPDWPNCQATETMIHAWARERSSWSNTGLLTRTTPAIDIDILDSTAAEELEALVRARFNSGRLLRRIGLPPKRAFLFKTATPFEKLQRKFIAPDGSEQKIEILGAGQQMIVDGIHPDTKKPYEWSGGEPWSVAREELVALDAAAAQAWLNEAAALLVALGWQEAGKNIDDMPNAGLPMIVQLAVRMWGNKLEQHGGEYRFGTHGSKSVDANNRTWFDFEANVGGGFFDLMRLVESKHEQTVFICAPHSFPDEATLPLWEFLYGNHLLRKTVSITAAMGATGKTSKSIVEMLAMAVGKPLLGEAVPRPLRVLLINLEDNREAMDKRIAAAMKVYKLKPEDIGGRMFTKAKGEFKLKIAKRAKNGSPVRNEAIIKNLIDFIIANKIDVVSIDPLVKTHGIQENDTDAMQEVIECYDDIAEAANCAVHLWHHTRKSGGGEVTIESVRGAGAIVDACRSSRILETMTKAEAKKLNLKTGSFHFREFSGRRTFAPPTDQSTWYELVNVTLNNGGGLFGDDVGVVKTWLHPGAKEIELNPYLIDKIKSVVGTNQWREDIRADMWVGKAVAQVVGLDPVEDKAVLARLVQTLLLRGALKRAAGKKAHREPTTLVVPGEDAPVQQPVQPSEG